MIHLLRAVAFVCFFASGLTLIRPKSGWGRLVLFIPKLFAGARIVIIAFVGGAAATAGWLLFQDPVSFGLGVIAVAVGFRHVARLIRRSRIIDRAIDPPGGFQKGLLENMLPYPWVGVWKTRPNSLLDRDVNIGRNTQTGDSILADVWSPPEKVEPSGLGLVFLHGSGWHYADKDFGTRHFFSHIAHQGHLIVDVAYSLAPKVDIFGMVADVKRAVIWVKQHSSDLQVYDDRIVLMGGSAGGHLALLAAYTPVDPRFNPEGSLTRPSVCGVISYYGPTDLKAQYDRFVEWPALTGEGFIERRFMGYLENRTGFEVIPVHNLIPKLLGGNPMEVPEVYELASPCEYVSEACPPTLLLQGSHDFSGVAPQVIQLHKSLLRAGAISYLLELPDTEHGFDLYKPRWSPAAQSATFVLERFLASVA